jgi:hypothetical protein
MELEETFLFNQTRPMFDNSSLSDIDLSLNGAVDGVFDNLSYLVCPINNFTYLNVTCEPTFELSLPLLGKELFLNKKNVLLFIKLNFHNFFIHFKRDEAFP